MSDINVVTAQILCTANDRLIPRIPWTQICSILIGPRKTVRYCASCFRTIVGTDIVEIVNSLVPFHGTRYGRAHTG